MNAVIPVPTRAQGNPYHPLPPSYFASSTTEEMRRLMRVNACRQWLLWRPMATDPPEHKLALRAKRADAFVAALRFFDLYYLHKHVLDSGEIDYDPMFYPSDPVPSPPYHDELSYARMMHRLVGAVGPRGSAKTFYWKKSIPFQLVTHPAYSFLYGTSMNDLAEDVGDDIKFTIYNNARIHDDFAPEPEFDGRIRPSRGEARQGMTGFALSNRSWATFTSSESRKRGKRPWEIAIDDPEWDPKQTTPMEILREWFHHLLTRVLLPMIQQPGTRLTWTGTFVSQQHYLWHMMQTKEIPDPLHPSRTITVAVDKLFDGWYRIIQPAATWTTAPRTDADGTSRIVRVRVSCWKHMWPVDNAEKAALGLPDDARTLDDIREEIGEAAFESEYMANPGSGIAAYFPALTPEAHGYTISEPDELLTTTPHLSGAKITWLSRNPLTRAPESRTMTLRDFCASFPSFVCCDTSYTATSFSDYKVALLMSLTDRNELFALDLFAAQCDEDTLVVETLKMSSRWLTSRIAVEGIKEGLGLSQRLLDIARTAAQSNFNIEWLPEIAPFNPGPSPKCAKIAAMKWRFDHALIKLPLMYREDRSRPWSMLFNQITGFQNRGGDDCGLQKDDCVDALSMHRFVVGGVPLSRRADAPASAPSAIELLQEGTTHDKAGPVCERLPPIETVPSDQIWSLIDAARTKNLDLTDRPYTGCA